MKSMPGTSTDIFTSNGNAPYWPKGVPATVRTPETSLPYNLEVAARRFPAKPALIFGEFALSYRQLWLDVRAVAGWLQTHGGLKSGDRVMVLSQNCPQFVIAFYAVLLAGGIVVPVNVMSTADEIAYYLEDSAAKFAFVASELMGVMKAQAVAGNLEFIVVHDYDDYKESPVAQAAEKRREFLPDPAVDLAVWQDVVAADVPPIFVDVKADDLAVLPYTSGTTGHPKGCMHTHRTLAYAALSSQIWRRLNSESVFLAVAPYFHMLGLQNGLNSPLAMGSTVVMLPRWDRSAALDLIERFKVTVWSAPPAVLIDFFGNPAQGRTDPFTGRALRWRCPHAGTGFPDAAGAVWRHLQRSLRIDGIRGVPACESA